MAGCCRQDVQALIAEYRGKFPEISENVLAEIVLEVRPRNLTHRITDICNIDFASKTNEYLIYTR